MNLEVKRNRNERGKDSNLMAVIEKQKGEIEFVDETKAIK